MPEHHGQIRVQNAGCIHTGGVASDRQQTWPQEPTEGAWQPTSRPDRRKHLLGRNLRHENSALASRSGIPTANGGVIAAPRLVVAAGSGTHRLLLALRKLRGSRSLVIMKPTFPLSLVSGAIIPAHDRVHPGPRVLLTEGVLNTITPLARITEKREALLLIGGPSPHFDWDDDVVLGQISHLIGHYPDWRWTIGTSRRTPEPMQERLDEMAGLRITVVHPDQTHEDWLSHQLSASRAVWVTPDSMSMVCEAATSGVPTGLFELPARSGSRVVEGVERLVRSGYVAQWTTTPALWQAGPTTTGRSGKPTARRVGSLKTDCSQRTRKPVNACTRGTNLENSSGTSGTLQWRGGARHR